jgi:Flp pilus assembly protein protease CpaA
MGENLEILKDWTLYALSFCASVVSYRDIFNKEDSWRLTLLKFLANFTTSLFAGLMSYLALKALQVEQGWIFVGVGIFAWRGSKGLEVIAAWIDKIEK